MSLLLKQTPCFGLVQVWIKFVPQIVCSKCVLLVDRFVVDHEVGSEFFHLIFDLCM